jgi:Rrf2 family protein
VKQTTSYAVLALSCLARNGGIWRQIDDISACIGIPKPYLAKVLHSLPRSGIVAAKRGYGGGYRLRHAARAIRLLDILEAMEGHAIEGLCMLGTARCSDERACLVHRFWKTTRTHCLTSLERVTLADLTRIEDGTYPPDKVAATHVPQQHLE